MAGRVWKRGETYHIAFSYKGTEYRKSALTNKKREAENLLAFYLGQCARGEFKGFIDQEPELTIHDLFDDLVRDATQRQLRDVKTMKQRIGAMRREFGSLVVSALTERRIDLHVRKRLEQGIAPATLTCEMRYLKQAFLLAQRKKLLQHIPHMPSFTFNNARQGFFEREEFDRVVACLPHYLQDFARFAYWSSWRKMEIASLEWRDIEGDTIRLRPTTVKTSEPRLLILTGEIGAIIERRRAERLDLLPYIFHRDGHKIQYNIDRPFKKACLKAGIEPKLLHDLRRTAVRNMVRAGVPERIAMAISGHKTRQVFDRYNIVNEDDIRQGLARLQAYVDQPKVLPFLGQNRTEDTQM